MPGYQRWVESSEAHSIDLAELGDRENILSPPILSINHVLLGSMHASWKNLVQVNTKDVNIEDIFKLLQQAPQLQQLRIEEEWQTHRLEPPAVAAPISHSSLMKLEIRLGRWKIPAFSFEQYRRPSSIT